MKNGLERWYLSPFRKEAEPSFHTSFLGGKWIWNDFGDEGGTVIDFVMRHENYHNVSDALKYLERFENKETGEVIERDPTWHDLLAFNPTVIAVLKGLNENTRIKVIGSLSFRPFPVGNSKN